MEFRHTQDDPPAEISLDQFCEMVRAGLVKPNALYRESWTHGEWLTVDNLRPFHKHSQSPHAPGARLAASEQRRDREAEFHGSADSYTSGPLVEDTLDVQPLEQCLTDPDVLGAARLFILPSFEAERLLSVTFRRDAVQLDADVASDSIWFSLMGQMAGLATASEEPAQTPDRAQIRAKAAHSRERLNYQDAPEPFSSWERFCGAAREAGHCETPTLDGVLYRHQVVDRVNRIDVNWSNPDRKRHIPQVTLLKAYTSLLRAVGWKTLMR